MDAQTVLILCLLAFIGGLVIGVILGKPSYPPRF
jgi:hypothetical protein